MRRVKQLEALLGRTIQYMKNANDYVHGHDNLDDNLTVDDLMCDYEDHEAKYAATVEVS